MTTDEWLGDYRLDGLLGRGGMGEVHRAVDTRRSRSVALKVLRADVAQDPGFRERFRREAGATAGLQSPHIVPIHDFGEIGGRLFIDMRLIHGTGLDAILTHGPLPVNRAVAIVGQVAEGLAHAHEHGVLHRDVKPSNILLTPSDFVYLVDFGIASRPDNSEPGLTATGMTIGTWAYMAPERFDAGPVDQRSDVYSLACVLAECLLGRRPFDGTGPASVMKAHLVAEPPRPSRERPDVGPALDEVLARGMAKDPARRYTSAREFAAAAVAAISGPVAAVPGPTAAISGPAPTRAWPAAAPPAPTGTGAPAVPIKERRGRIPLMAGAGVVALLLAVVAGIALGRMGTEQPPAQTPVAGGAPSTAQPAPPPALPSALPAAGSGASGYTYTIDGNYPAHLIYTDAEGDRITAGETPAPWSLAFDTSAWGADARPMLSAFTMSSRGDTYLECTITDAEGRVVANQRKETANAAVSCMSFG
ncbi:serine/threonine-protein kinase [Pseudonocardia parietis]|uniref:non-specific serine/threonine protein kinase n=1 Tax=Pseudonocardia parietis TaxID=570936 RepID=A0ABS4VXZ6_9PSEU|nr:serine/threonine-protein kinase [Pseudonocardia parietis]MBP2368819.1 serine/threonine-protein kinase [Pseudonocardia parietis]